VSRDAVRYAAEHAVEAPLTVRPKHDEIGTALLGAVDDRLPWIAIFQRRCGRKAGVAQSIRR